MEKIIKIDTEILTETELLYLLDIEQSGRLKIMKNKSSEIEDILLKFASLYNEVPTSDLQGIATVEAKKIMELF